MISKEAKTIDELIKDAFDEALVKIGVSFAALIVLAIFFNAIRDFGVAQVIGLFIIHLVSLLLIGTAYKPKNINQAIVGLSFGVLWNIAVIAYIIYLYSDAITVSIPGVGTIDTRPPSGTIAGTIFLAYWFIASIFKFNKLKKKKEGESKLLI